MVRILGLSFCHGVVISLPLISIVIPSIRKYDSSGRLNRMRTLFATLRTLPRTLDVLVECRDGIPLPMSGAVVNLNGHGLVDPQED